MENTKWFNKNVEDVEKELKTNLEKGLNDEEVKTRQEKYGLNELKTKKKKSLIQKFLEQFKDFSIIVLIIAFTITTINIIIVSVIPFPSAIPTAPDTIAAIIKTIIEKSLNCSKNF